MQMTDFCDHLYNESTDGYIQILKLDDKNNSGERTIKSATVVKRDSFRGSRLEKRGLRGLRVNGLPRLYRGGLLTDPGRDFRLESGSRF